MAFHGDRHHITILAPIMNWYGFGRQLVLFTGTPFLIFYDPTVSLRIPFRLDCGAFSGKLVHEEVTKMLLVSGVLVAFLHCQTEPLSVEEESVIRSSVYEKKAELTTRKGLTNDIPDIVLPKDVQDIYNKNPAGTIRLLVVIAEGASPADSGMAVIYAIALIEKDGFGAADIMLNRLKRNSYDSMKPGTTETWRKHWILMVNNIAVKNKIKFNK